MSNIDWTGNSCSVFVTMGASSHSKSDREVNDYYATAPYAIDVLIKECNTNLSKNILEPACGEGHLSKD